MLAALLVTFLSFMVFAGPGGLHFGDLTTRHMHGQIKAAIADKDRRQAALQGLAAVDDDIENMNQQLAKDTETLEKLIRDYESQPQDFDHLFASVLAYRQRQIDKIWDDRQAMLKHIRADEWQTIFSGAKAEMEKAAANKKK